MPSSQESAPTALDRLRLALRVESDQIVQVEKKLTKVRQTKKSLGEGAIDELLADLGTEQVTRRRDERADSFDAKLQSALGKCRDFRRELSEVAGTGLI